MLMPPFELHHPTTVEEAVAAAAALMEKGEAFDWVAGGTDVLPNYKWRINPKPHVISLAGIDSAHTLSSNEIGCMVPLSSLTADNGVVACPKKRDRGRQPLPRHALLLVQSKRGLAKVHRLVPQSRLRHGR